MGRPTQLHAATSDIAEASQSLEDAYGTPMEVRSEPRDFRFALDSVTDGRFGLARLAYTGAGVTRVESFTDYIVAMSVSGELAWRIGQRTGCGADPFVLRPGEDLHADWHDMRLLSLTLAAELIEEAGRAFASHSGDACAPRSAGDLRYVREVMLHLHASARRAPDLLEQPLIRAAMAQAAAQAVLVSFGVGDDVAERAALPRTIRRAVRFLDDHLGEPVTVADAARAAGLSVRALEAGFRRELDRSPTEYLRQARLAAAHEELQRADPLEVTVRGIAARWGFAHPSRFANDYRREFGELPSATLRR